MANPFMQAVQRVAQQHYGGNMQQPSAQRWLARINQDPNAQANIATQQLIRRLMMQAQGLR